MQTGILKEAVKALSKQQAEETKKLFNHILTTSKNFSLYPENHDVCKDSIKRLYEKLEGYIRKNGDITIEIEKNRVLCQNIEVQTGPSEEGTIFHILFRDGIGRLQFEDGIELTELQQVFSIVHKYSILVAEPQGDIITDFWETRFEHVQYKADDFFSEQTSDQTDSGPKTDATLSAGEDETAIQNAGKTFLSGGHDIDPEAFELSPREEIVLQEMVDREEAASVIQHLNMLLDMLLQYEEEQDFNVVLEVLTEEFKSSFGRHDFESALIILYGIREVLDSGRLSAPWAVQSLEALYEEISSNADCLKPLEDVWGMLDMQQVETLRQIFQYLNPPVINALVNLMIVPQPEEYGQILEEAVFVLVCKDMGCLESVINDSSEKKVAKLVPVISKLDNESSRKYLMKLARHSSALIRRKAIKTLLNEDGNKITAIFNFIDDTDDSIRRMVLSQMGKFKNESSENFLLQYLQNKKFSEAQSEHILECFKVLGKCGSSKSLPFLSKTLMNLDLMCGSKKSVYREGAAFALSAMDIPEARQIIAKAGRSFRPRLRKIAREAEKALFKGGR